MGIYSTRNAVKNGDFCHSGDNISLKNGIASGFLKPWDYPVWPPPKKKWDQPENVNSVKSPRFSG
jgi:hypothetical protein